MDAARRPRVAILGAGTVAHDHAAAVRLCGGTVVAACTRSPESPRWAKFAAAFPEAEFRSAEAIMAAEDIDAVVACPSWFAMDRLLAPLLAMDKPVLVEKPAAVDVAVMEQALAGASPRDDKLVGFCRRYYAPVVRLGQRLAEGGLVSAQVRVSENLTNLVRRWGADILPHVLAYSSCHVLDLAMHLLGPLRVDRVFRRPVQGFAPFQAINGVLATAAGLPVFLSVNPDDPCVVGVECHFDDGTIWQLGPIERLSVFKGYDIIEPTPDFNVRRYAPKVIETVVADTSFRPGFLEQMRAFLSGDLGPGARPVESLELLRLISDLNHLDG